MGSGRRIAPPWQGFKRAKGGKGESGGKDRHSGPRAAAGTRRDASFDGWDAAGAAWDAGPGGWDAASAYDAPSGTEPAWGPGADQLAEAPATSSTSSIGYGATFAPRPPAPLPSPPPAAAWHAEAPDEPAARFPSHVAPPPAQSPPLSDVWSPEPFASYPGGTTAGHNFNEIATYSEPAADNDYQRHSNTSGTTMSLGQMWASDAGPDEPTPLGHNQWSGYDQGANAAGGGFGVPEH